MQNPLQHYPENENNIDCWILGDILEHLVDPWSLMKAIINNSNPNISNPEESGTTIANSVPGTIVRIESKAERPQYFIVVGSLPNENLALDEAKNYQGKAAEIFLIAPYEESRNYRLAVGKYNSFKSAAEDLERIKSNYSESLWILKY